eukprot:scaffold1216_cov136-Amphora_coffeaeformis.AAC.4
MSQACPKNAASRSKKCWRQSLQCIVHMALLTMIGAVVVFVKHSQSTPRSHIDFSNTSTIPLVQSHE